MYMYMYVHIHVHVYTRTVYMYTHVHVYTCTVYKYTHMSICMSYLEIVVTCVQPKFMDYMYLSINMYVLSMV